MAKIEEFRRLVRPKLEAREITQEEVAARLTAIAGKPIAQTTVSRWLDGSDPRHSHTRNAVAQLVDEIREGAWPTGNGVGEVLEEIEAGGGMTDVERYYLAELQRIAASAEPETVKIMARDSLASSLSRLGNIIADRAAEARARAIEKAESAGESRAVAIQKAEETANIRTLTLHGGINSDPSGPIREILDELVTLRQQVEGERGVMPNASPERPGRRSRAEKG